MAKPRSKKLLNDISSCVDENLAGHVALNPGLRLVEGHRIVVRADFRENVTSQGHVAIMLGGGSGHEPFQIGYVGEGMGTAAVAGDVFASPPSREVLAALRLLGRDNSAGVLVVVANYTGDRLNFGLGVERARGEGLKVGVVTVGEDCAHLPSRDRSAGRRGLTGYPVMVKIAGALSEEGKSLEEMEEILNGACSKLGSLGLSLSACSVPGSGPTFEVKDDEMELGLGVHGEPGMKTMKLTTAKEAVEIMLSHMTDPENPFRVKLEPHDPVACVINNLGATTVLEMNVVAGEVIRYLERKGVAVERAYCGAMETSQEMAGIIITILHLDDTLRRCLDAPTTAPAWPRQLLPPGEKTRTTPEPLRVAGLGNSESDHGDDSVASLSEAGGRLVYEALKGACEALIGAEADLNALDRQGGDGDCGSTLAKGAREVLRKLGSVSSPGLPVQRPSLLAASLASVAEVCMGGASGGLYSLFLTSVAAALRDTVEPEAWGRALDAGVMTLQRYGGARPGDRTMLDPLCAAVGALRTNLGTMATVDALDLAVKEAQEAAAKTVGMHACAGRSSYVSPARLTGSDPGAQGVVTWLTAVLKVIKEHTA